jgi:predicted ATPase
VLPGLLGGRKRHSHRPERRLKKPHRLLRLGDQAHERRQAAEETGQHYWDSELHRLRGELAGDDSELRRAIEIARAQNAAWPELRAAVALARRLGAPGRELLAPIYERFEEGFSTRELREAAELLGVEVPVP